MNNGFSTFFGQAPHSNDDVEWMPLSQTNDATEHRRVPSLENVPPLDNDGMIGAQIGASGVEDDEIEVIEFDASGIPLSVRHAPTSSMPIWKYVHA